MNKTVWLAIWMGIVLGIVAGVITSYPGESVSSDTPQPRMSMVPDCYREFVVRDRTVYIPVYCPHDCSFLNPETGRMEWVPCPCWCND